nr:acyltransferase [Allochromatium palmeri]
MVRGLAAWMVFTAHAAHLLTPDPAFLKFLWTGVDLFFVISGFVFAPLLLSGGFAIRAYAIRRVFRLYPLYLVSLPLYYLIAPESAEKFVYLLKHLLFLGTTSGAHEAFFFNPAYWSLPVEVEYYLLLPLLARLVAGRFWVVLGLFAIFCCLRFGIVLGATPFAVPEPNWLAILRVHLPGILIEFLVGVFVYVAHQHWLGSAQRSQALLAGLMGLVLWLALGLFFARHGDQGIGVHLWLKAYFSLLCAIGYGLMLFGLLGLMRCEDGWCRMSAFFLGNLSYGVYLFHILVLRLYAQSGLSLPGVVAFIACALSVLALAMLGHHLVEHPARTFGRRLASRYAPVRRDSR